jgi:dihydrodipicolinate synthase/N-acetylneuraminate lyase
MQTVKDIDPPRMIRPKRKILGMSAVLLPFLESGSVDWDGFCRHVCRTSDVGLVPAVNMDTGYVNLIDADTRRRVVELTRQTLGARPFAAGAFLADQPGAAFDVGAYARQIEPIRQRGGTPVIFPSWGLNRLPEERIADAYAQIGAVAERFIAFELGEMFAPFGRIYSLATYRRLIEIPQCTGAKHSSLSRQREWERLALRDELRADFAVLTGNDLAIDMVMYGSDYLLGLSTFAPDLFTRRDALWQAADARFYEINDVLQYLGALAFRPPVPAYKHSAAQFLKLRGWIVSDRTHAQSPQRPPSDVEILRPILSRIVELLQ